MKEITTFRKYLNEGLDKKSDEIKEDIYDDIVAADDDILDDMKDDAAEAYRKVDKGAEFKKAVSHVKSKMTKKDLKEKIKSEILSTLSEAEEDEIEDVEDIKIDVDVEAPSESEAEPGLTKEEMEIQNSLKRAYDTAISIGDEKLSNQIANTITFFTKTHIVPRD